MLLFDGSPGGCTATKSDNEALAAIAVIQVICEGGVGVKFNSSITKSLSVVCDA